MLAPPDPPDEDTRLLSLRNLNVLDTPAEGRFDRITRLARRMFGVPIVAISLVDRARQWFKSIDGLDVEETPRDVSFCGHAILGDAAMVIEDAHGDERFADNPLVTGDPRIRFYAGQPLVSSDGHKLGTLCLIDREPRQLTDRDRLALQDLAAMAEAELNAARMHETQRELVERLEQVQRQALLDPLTRLWNRAGILKLLETELGRADRDGNRVGVVLLDLDHFKSINDTHGHEAGDAVLREVARRMRAAVRTTDACGRIGGEEFLIVLPGCDEALSRQLAERVRVAVAGEEVSLPGRPGDTILVTLSLGVTSSLLHEGVSPTELLRRADRALYSAKDAGRNRVVLHQAEDAV